MPVDSNAFIPFSPSELKYMNTVDIGLGRPCIGAAGKLPDYIYGLSIENIHRFSADKGYTRVENVATIKGIKYINDSGATKVNAAWFALEQMTRPVIWIAGGQPNERDFYNLPALNEVAAKKVKALVLLGVDTTALQSHFRKIVPSIFTTASMREAVEYATTLANANDVILFSPGCASFEMYAGHMTRGNEFTEAVARIEKGLH